MKRIIITTLLRVLYAVQLVEGMQDGQDYREIVLMTDLHDRPVQATIETIELFEIDGDQGTKPLTIHARSWLKFGIRPKWSIVRMKVLLDQQQTEAYQRSYTFLKRISRKASYSAQNVAEALAEELLHRQTP